MIPRSPFEPGAQVAAYLRDSGGERQDLSVERQENVIRAWCADNGLVLTQIYADAAKPGGSTVGRDAFNALASHFQSGDALEAGVVFWDYSRIARSFDDAQFFLASLRRKGYKVFSLDNLIPAGATGKVVESLYLWSAEQYRERLAADVKSGLRHLVGRYHGWPNNSPPTGYKLQPVEIGTRRDGSPHTVNRLAPDPLVAPLVKLGYELAVQGRSLSEINRQTGLFHDLTGVAYMLSNRIYTGVYDHKGLEVPDFCPAIIPDDLFRQARRARAQAAGRAGWHHPRSVHSSLILSGMVTCARCGRALTRSYSNGRGYYVCHNLPSRVPGGACTRSGIDIEALEKRVRTRLEEQLARPELLQELSQELTEQRKGERAEYQALLEARRAHLSDLEASIDRVLEGIASRPKSAALLKKLDELEQEQITSREQLAQMESDAPDPDLSPLELTDLCADLRRRLETTDTRTLQLLYRALYTRVIVKRDPGRDTTRFSGTVVFEIGVMVTLAL
jgi:site-specific DNA recombinase